MSPDPGPVPVLTAPVLSVRNLTTVYRTRSGVVRAVDDVSFDVQPGSTMGLVGESGCGKSATALSITRMIPSYAGEITSGSVTLEDTDLMSLRRDELRRVRGAKIGFIPQDPLSSLNPLMSIGRQIGEVVRQHRGASRAEARRSAIALLDRVGIPRAQDRVRDYPHQFSGGMRQRAAIAMAIACDPILLLADEPTTALDVTVQAQVLEVLIEIKDEIDSAIMLITHDLGVAAHMCDDIRVMYAGQIVEEAGIDDFFESPQSPYAQGLLTALPSAPLGPDGRLRAIRGTPPSLRDDLVGCRFAARCPEVRPLCHEAMPELTERDEAGHRARCWGTEPGGWVS